MNPEQTKKISKRLSLHLRHEPGELGLTLQEGGWVSVETLLVNFSRKYGKLSRTELEEVVRDNDKRRFSFDESGSKIRANQGHSVEVDLQLQPQTPPELLFHGTNANALQTVLAEGLKKMSRHHVHLSPDTQTATKVGSRRGKPILLMVRSGDMHRAGHQFYCSDNGVWLTDEVPSEFLEALK